MLLVKCSFVASLLPFLLPILLPKVQYSDKKQLTIPYMFTINGYLKKLIVIIRSDNKKGEFARFVIVGIIAATIHYIIYFVLYHWINVSISYTIGYILSWFCNLYLTSKFTFNRKATLKKSVGFAGAHIINYCVHIFLLQFFLWLGTHKALAPFFVMGIATIINFFLVRTVFVKINSK